MNELIKKYNVDLNRFNPIFIQGFKDITSRKGELYGLPVSPFFSRVLYYNKDLFNKFGQPYLKDGMSMDEVYNVAKTMTRSEGGVDYRGYSANITSIVAYNSYSLPSLDPVKDQMAGMDTWKKIFESYARFYQIPNNKVETSVSGESVAYKKGNVAMWSDNYSPYLDLSMMPNWDMVSVPLVDGAPRKVGIFTPGYLMITKQSKYKDDAFKVIMEMLSDEVQLKDSRNGFLPTLANNKYIDVLAQDSPTYKGKNIKAVTYYEFAPVRPARAEGMTVVDSSTADSFIRNAFLNVAIGKEDVNSALRNADELLRKEVEKVKSQSK
jgi:multiple sugar transport system substrate-binding protein